MKKPLADHRSDSYRPDDRVRRQQKATSKGVARDTTSTAPQATVAVDECTNPFRGRSPALKLRPATTNHLRRRAISAESPSTIRKNHPRI